MQSPSIVSEIRIRSPQALPPAVHTPFWQVSGSVHVLLSLLHDAPSPLLGFEQLPELTSHAPATWHWSEAAHTLAFPLHTPLWHVSLAVHAFPSLHAAASAFAGFEHNPVPGSRVPAT
jgi:hypothetical protein